MKIYVVTAGEYSDYHIEKVFSDKHQAHMYSLLESDRRVEQYELDDVTIKTNKKFIKVTYYFKWQHVEKVELCSKEIKPMIDRKYGSYFEFTLPLSDKKLYSNIMRYGKNCGLIQKITRDKFMQYLYEHETTVEELIRKQNEKWEKQNNPYYFLASTSSDTCGPNMHDPPFNPYYYADARMPDIMKQYADEHDGAFPDMLTLAKMYADQVADVKEEHEKEES